ncbi:MAG: hypothetical protein HGB08_02750 [Candidatus Moranbacteria bacterium]|nr:hypothetical protein [Candidatus Moranbacteria bacterium]
MAILIRKFFRIILRISITIAIIAIVFSPNIKERLSDSITNIPLLKKRSSVVENKTVELTDPTEKSFDWKYRNQSYSIDLTLYQSLYDYYYNLPRQYQYQGTLPTDWEEQYAGMFLTGLPNDRFITELADAIRAQAQKSKLTDDQSAELILAFVQALPYDDAGAKELLSDGYGNQDGIHLPRYPYETLFDKKGICSDKSFLAYLLLKQAGYGVALFEYPDAHHMAIGIQCPDEYSTYGSGYCYAETTAPENIIGLVPNLDPLSNKPLANQDIPYFGAEAGNQTALGDPNILAKTAGKSYGGIVATLKTEKKIVQLKSDIQSMDKQLALEKQRIASDKEELESMKTSLDKYKKNKDYEKYNSLAKEYNDQADAYSKEVSAYNAKINSYNQKVREYNKLIKSFYP